MSVVLDNSGWIELLSGSDLAPHLKPPLGAERLFVSSIIRDKLIRYVLLHKGPSGRELALTALSKFEQVAIDEDVADTASELAQVHKLAMADALVYAVAQIAQAELWTQDKDFERLPSVRYFPKN